MTASPSPSPSMNATATAARAALALGAALLPLAPADAQTVCTVKIADFETINPYGVRPALHDGVVAFLGEDKDTGISGIFVAPADGSGPITAVADETMIAPNQPDTFFIAFWNPDIHGDQVVFAGRYDGSNIDGIYLAENGGLTTLVDAPLADNQDAIGPEGVVWETGGTFSTPWFKPAGGAPFPVVAHGDPMVGGGTFVDIDPHPPTLHNGVIALAAYVTHSTGVDGGVYLYDVEAGTQNLVANWTVQMPGRPEFFDYFHAADCDGQNVILVGKSGFINFGGHQGLYLAPAASPANEPAPLTTIAEMGGPAPGGGTFHTFGDVAIDGDVIVFEAFLENQGPALFARIGAGPIFKVAEPGQEIEGITPTTIDFNFRGLDGNQIVFRGTIGPPPGGGTFNYALFTATLHADDGVECPDPDAPGPPVLPDCREWFDAPAPDAPSTVSLRDVDVVADDDIWVAGGSGFTAHWNGTTWTNFPTPAVAGAPVYLENIDASAPDDVWAVGNYGAGSDVFTASFHWNGEQWTHVPTPNPHPTQNWLMGVEAIAPDDVWAVGFTGGGPTNFHMVHWDGNAWTVQSLPDDPGTTYDALEGISGTGPDDIWAAGSAGIPAEYEAIIFHYDGKGWTKQTGVPQPLSNPVLYDVVAIRPDLAWAVGSHFLTGFGHRTMTMRWDGTGWQPVASPNPGQGWNFLFGVDGIDDQHVFAAGYHYYGAVNEPIALTWNPATNVWEGHDLEMSGYSTSAWAAGALSDGSGLAVGTVGYFGGTPADALFRTFTRPGGPADLTCDGAVDVADLVELLLRWGPCPAPPAPCSADLDGSGAVDVADLVEVLLEWS